MSEAFLAQGITVAPSVRLRFAMLSSCLLEVAAERLGAWCLVFDSQLTVVVLEDLSKEGKQAVASAEGQGDRVQVEGRLAGDLLSQFGWIEGCVVAGAFPLAGLGLPTRDWRSTM